MKVSVITVVYNGESFLEACIKSVIAQDYADLEYIIIDGASTDGTLNIIKKYENHIYKFVSEADKGLYDAVNKGLNLASGAVIGLLNADDMLASNSIITEVATSFKNDGNLQALYGDLNYIHPTNNKIIRKWTSRQAGKKDFENGWMPAHPTLYIKKDVFEKYGNYALDLGTAADYDLMLRFLYVHHIKSKYLPMLMVNMRTGGLSNGSLRGILKAAKNDWIALRRNKLPLPLLILLKKKLNKIEQFFLT
ncbi:glycosyltransferase family 2 protein [Pedobacter sp. Leaf132]|uniref:glycosyltransferase family 2 protein n=1 Tax=Pedobacter sp. Leaf132 TaxID=2876557 RepID=UPI001E4AEC59|nr:glycosyltransferase family 2 protein [Pedobacter sp. Leaf132]